MDQFSHDILNHLEKKALSLNEESDLLWKQKLLLLSLKLSHPELWKFLVLFLLAFMLFRLETLREIFQEASSFLSLQDDFELIEVLSYAGYTLLEL